MAYWQGKGLFLFLYLLFFLRFFLLHFFLFLHLLFFFHFLLFLTRIGLAMFGSGVTHFFFGNATGPIGFTLFLGG
ncbi:MAG: hypothetical protein FHK78_08285 [Sedimenticola selenatireducens]|uniref:Uncharacterized protein n=1 Tax=Sedimenticola selenatireducens TaxID=191960 RepID=A0A557SHC2_9GAMM|nr:hypothetical protein FHP88_05040 [Sedimenticola selenatireducens]TVT64234.1 MAG: hypothetical protein FHK78_08285 [Sedimenticola selenatireducens]